VAEAESLTGVHRKQLEKWSAQREDIQSRCENGESKRCRRSGGGRKLASHDLDERLYGICCLCTLFFLVRYSVELTD
jgi:hypothetical protein